MVNDDVLRRAGVPTNLLGMSRRSWRGTQLRIMLDHFGQEYNWGASKLELMRALHVLSEERALTRRDRLSILSAHKSGERIQQPLATMQIPSITNGQQGPNATIEGAVGQTKAFALFDRAPEAMPVEHHREPAPSPALFVTTVRECVVCYDTLDANNTPQQRTTSSCQHEPNVCRQCIITSINSQFTNKIWDQIQCPSCNGRLGYHDMQNFAEQETFERYDRLTLEAWLNGSHYQRCRANNCSSGQQCFPEDDSYIICRECGGRTCITCDAVWHSGETCDEFRTRKREEAASRDHEEMASAEFIKKETKSCPGCRAPTHRYAGCDHITCRRCTHQYCWLCFADYSLIARHGNAHHREDCIYHTRNLPPLPGMPLPGLPGGE